MIKTGGANVSPAELEVQLRACRPVKLAWVVGVPDRRLGQLVVMCVTLKEGTAATEDDIKQYPAPSGWRLTRCPSASCSSTTGRSR